MKSLGCGAGVDLQALAQVAAVMKPYWLDFSSLKQTLAAVEDGLDVVDWATTSAEFRAHIATHSTPQPFAEAA